MNLISLIKQIVSRIKSPVYRLFYLKESNGHAEVYYLQNPKFDKNWFGNEARKIKRKGFRAWSINRNAYRSFNYEGIIDLQKVGLLDPLK